MSGARGLLDETSGQATTNLLGFSMTWFVVFGVFLMNVQLGQLFLRRDVVDHAAALAADSATKTFCAHGPDRAFAESEAMRVVDPVLSTAATTDGRRCALHVDSTDGVDPGAAELDIVLECSFDCKIPVAAQVMCKAGRTSFASRLKAVALGCDRKGG